MPVTGGRMQHRPAQVCSEGVGAERQPERQCIGCGRRGPQAGFVRLGLDDEATPPRVIVALGRDRRGRGAYLCRRQACLDRALHRKAFQRAFRKCVAPDVEQISRALEMERAAGAEANDTAGG
jgi:predicted RNA-binding protein YlxR (DUF448 family)